MTRLVTVALNEHERGALISFDYNCGGLTVNGQPSTVLRRLNAGDMDGTVEALKAWNKFGGKVCDGLVRRRAAEVALFLRPHHEVEPDYMPQSAETPKRKMSPAEMATAAATVTGGGATAAHQSGAVPVASKPNSVTELAPIDRVRAAIDKGKEVREIAVDARGLIPGVPAGAEIYAIPGAILALGLVATFVLHRRSSS